MHQLIQAYGLFNQLDLLIPPPVSPQDLTTFHDEDYIESLFENSAESLVDDCPHFPLLQPYLCHLVGATTIATQALTSGTHSIVIHWDGGRHHAKRDEASGFCYVNDVVVAVEQLLDTFDRVLVIDLDIHHGDGVQEAFYYSDRVYTYSMHLLELGFFPGSGTTNEQGAGRGKGFCTNVPMKPGLSDELFKKVFESTIAPILALFSPKMLVVVCGADGLVGDRIGQWNLLPSTLAWAVGYLKQKDLPMLVLGGGGYHHANTARCWTSITATLVDQVLDDLIPEHEYWPLYAPDYTMTISPSQRPDLNLD